MADMAPLDPAKTAAAAFKLLAENPMFKVGEADIRGNVYRVFENAPPSLAALFAHGAATHGDKEFLIFEEERVSFAEIWRRACRLAHALQDKLGVKQGDKVALAMRNYPEWCVSYMAVIALGGVVVPLNAWWKDEELHYGLQDCGAKIVIADARRLEYILPSKKELGLTLVLAREGGDGADYRYEDLLAQSKNDAMPAVDIHPDDDFCIVYTSGSTGHPKGVVLTHRGAISALFSWSFIAAILKELRGGVSPFGDDPGILLGIPLFHVTGSHSIFLLSYMVGRRVVMMYRWDPKEAAAIINREKLTNFVGVPSQSFELMQAVGPEGLPTLIDIGSGGAKRPADHVKKLAAKFQNGKPSSGYGLSETNALGCVISQGDYQLRPDSTGRPVPPVTDIKIMEGDKEQPVGGVGEVWIRSPANFRGYHNLPDETAKAITPDGWFKTGDLGKFDADGYLYIVDRLKDLIIRGGENISCLEVENRVYEHGDVAEAVVFSVPDEVLGERVGLVVYPKEGMSVDAADLRDFVAEELAAFKVPERIWISPAKLPRLGTAKFDKITVRKIALQHPPALSV
ncbi:class I adenylate-forming enzyme family protein [Hyphococcus sp.]|jgi:acyl-CoA synthetase (AMP-forming)/AMP-acid ligase II|uniref:class I adenylate-forming enzyme family protein n=1 Tax=Hyphococcus sp. TaxID=2038636 RepID=UPI003D12B8BC